MITLKGQNIHLRALEPEDVNFIYEVENDESVWEISHTQTPYSKYLIVQYLENAQQDIYEAKQLRLAICNNNSFKAIGLIDLFEFDPVNRRAGVGILIHDKQNRGRGIGSEVLQLIVDYAFTHLNLHQLFANIDPQNKQSVNLFTKFGFAEIGTKKQWNFVRGSYRDETLYQLLNTK